MTADRMTAAEYRSLVAEKKTSHGSKRSMEPNPYRGLRCLVCGAVVRTTDPREERADIDTIGKATLTVRHLGCRAEAS